MTAVDRLRQFRFQLNKLTSPRIIAIKAIGYAGIIVGIVVAIDVVLIIVPASYRIVPDGTRCPHARIGSEGTESLFGVVPVRPA